VTERPKYDVLTDDDRSIEPERLSEVLGVAVSGVEILDETSGSANRLRLKLTYADDPGDLPEQMFMKRNLARFSFPAEIYSTEVRIYRDVLPQIDLERAKIFGIDSADDEIKFWILMEDLSLRADARLGYVLDPTTPDEIDSLLETMSRFHAPWWDDDRLTRELPWALPPTENAQMQFWANIGPQLTKRHLESGHRAELIDPAKWPEDAWWPAFRRLIDINSQSPHTLIHGDVHASNVYYVKDAPSGILDWQMALRGCWAVDFTYILTSGLSTEDRRASEKDLLKGYLERLRARGVDAPSFDDAWLLYRQNALYGLLMWLITPDGVHTDEAQIEFVERCFNSVADLESMGALAG